MQAVTVEQADAISRASRIIGERAVRFNGVLDFRLDGIERAFDDLQHDGVDPRAGSLGATGHGWTYGVHVHRTASGVRRAGRTDQDAVHIDLETLAGKTTVVEPNSSTTAGPSSRKPAGSDAR